MTRIAVTGASGFLARHLIPELLEEGHEVVGLARRQPQPSHAGTLPGFTFVAGDVRNRKAVEDTVSGAEWVIHLAASTQPEDRVEDIIERGTETVLAASVRAKRLIFVSCLGAVASSRLPFYRAKWRAEMLVRASSVPHVILQPSLLVGNGDGLMRPLAAMLRSLPAVPVPGAGRGRTQPIDVRDLVRCILIALGSDDLLGQSVPVGGPVYVTLRQVIDLVANELRISRPKLLLPPAIVARLPGTLPSEFRSLYSGTRLAPFEESVVVSPGIVESQFGFPASNFIPGIASYIAGG